MKKRLRSREPAHALTELQQQLDEFQEIYNCQRGHRALGKRTPEEVYHAGVKAHPTKESISHDWRTRYDKVDKGGKLTLRRAGKLHHMSVGAAHAGEEVLMLIDQTTVIVTLEHSGEILSQHHIEPERNYWRDQL